MKRWSFSAFCALAVLLVGVQAQAQQCPAGITNPLQLLDGTSWTFSTEAANFSPPGDASEGYFKAKFVPTNAFNQQGVLTIVETVNQVLTTGQVTRLAQVSGTYSIYPNCSGGVLTFMLSNQPVQFEFVFANNFTEIYMMSESSLPVKVVESIATGAVTCQSNVCCDNDGCKVVMTLYEILVGTAVMM